MTDGRGPVQRPPRFTPARDAVVAVASHSFPNHPTLRRELLDSFPIARFNETGIAHDIVSSSEFYRQNGVTPVSLAQLLAEADTSPCTRRSIDRREDSSANVNSPQ